MPKVSDRTCCSRCNVVWFVEVVQVSPIEVDLFSPVEDEDFKTARAVERHRSTWSIRFRNEHEQNTQRNDRLSLISADERIETYEFVHTLNTHCTLKQVRSTLRSLDRDIV